MNAEPVKCSAQQGTGTCGFVSKGKIVAVFVTKKSLPGAVKLCGPAAAVPVAVYVGAGVNSRPFGNPLVF